MGLSQSRQSRYETRRDRRPDWWQAIKFGGLTVAVGALQWLKFAILSLEEAPHQRRRVNQRLSSRQQQEERGKETGFAAELSPETRRALVNLIDYQITPVLVDQWRLELVKVLLRPEDGPVLPEEDPHLRQGLLESLKTYQEAEARRPTFREGGAPAGYAQPYSHRRIVDPGPVRRREGMATATTPRITNVDQNTASSSRPLPSAPPLLLDETDTAPQVAPVKPGMEPSAPSLQMEELDPEWDQCGICMDSTVQVAIEGCGHQLCCECAKAICCLEVGTLTHITAASCAFFRLDAWLALQNRAPQCPFCRGAMKGILPI